MILLTLLFFTSCQSEELKHQIILITPQGHEIQTAIAVTLEEQQKGLSGIADSDFAPNQGLFFYYTEEDYRNFWMPDTYFDLDLFYLDKDLRIIDIVRRLQHYKGKANPELIPRARPVWCLHVLEMKHDSTIAKSLQLGDLLKIKDSQRSTSEYLKQKLK